MIYTSPIRRVKHGCNGCLAIVLLWCGGISSAELIPAQDYGGFLIGYRHSIPGWGGTLERVQTLDLVPRYCHVLNRELGRGWLRVSRELWVEAPLSILLSDTDHQDAHDVGLISANFLLALVGKSSEEVEPYITLGGGPVYVLADIRGVGSDLCGNYQAGFGVRFKTDNRRIWNLELRYHHISNLDMARPNIALNSLKLNAGWTFGF